MYYIVMTIAMLLMVLSMKGLSAFEVIVIFAIGAPITYWLVKGWQRAQALRAYQKQIAEEKFTIDG